jgi:hypothetical protein
VRGLGAGVEDDVELAPDAGVGVGHVGRPQAVSDIATRPDWSAVSADVVTDFYTRVLGLGATDVPNANSGVWSKLNIIFNAGT